MSSELKATAITDAFLRGLQVVAEEPNSPPWSGAAELPVSAVEPVAGLLSHDNQETRRYAQRALEVLVRRSTAPGQARRRKGVQAALIKALKQAPPESQRVLVWLLSECGDERAVAALEGPLRNPVTSEDARCALLRMPTKRALKALQTAYESCQGSFKPALADAIARHPAQT